MKKLFAIVVMLMVVFGLMSIAQANNDPIWDYVYDFWKETNQTEYDMFVTTEYGSNGFTDNQTAYYAGNNCSLFYDTFHTMPEIEEYINSSLDLAGVKDYNVKVNVIGTDKNERYVLEITINTQQDLTKMENSGLEEFNGPVYTEKMICWDRICVPYEER